MLSRKLRCPDSLASSLMNRLHMNCTLSYLKRVATSPLCRINGKHRIWCFTSTACLFCEAPVCKQLHNHFWTSNLTEIIQCDLKLVHTVFRSSMSMGSLFSGWQRDKCCIVRFLSLDGLGRFVFWSRGRMAALCSLGLLISPVQSTPPGKLLRFHDNMIEWSLFASYAVEDRCPLSSLQDCLCLLAGGQTPGEEFIAGNIHAVLFVNWQHGQLLCNCQLQVAGGEVGFLVWFSLMLSAACALRFLVKKTTCWMNVILSGHI